MKEFMGSPLKIKKVWERFMNKSRRGILLALAGLPLVFATASVSWAQTPSASGRFEEIVRSVRTEAAQRGVSARTLDRALTGVQPLTVEHLENNQPERASTVTFAQYYGRQVTPVTMASAREFRRSHHNTFAKTENDYGVPAEVLLAILNIESRFGDNKGDKKVIPALLTLLRDVRGEDDRARERRAMFRENAIQALIMVDRGYDEILDLNGSWAGAVGPAQFMPKSIRDYGVDVNGDGKVDMWNDYREVIPSMAHYLKEKGWKTGERWGRKVNIPDGLDKNLFTDTLKHQINKTPSEWAALGITQADGSPLPANNEMRGMLIAPNYNVKTGSFSGPFYLVYDNFRTVMEYNKSYKYALTVLQMSDALSAPSPSFVATPPASSHPAPYNQ